MYNLSKMEIIPEHIADKIITDAIILKRNTNGWKNINKIITRDQLYVKRTNNQYNNDVFYEKILRLSTSIFFRGKQKQYTWLKTMNHNKLIHYKLDF
jgi:hypothetical protein